MGYTKSVTFLHRNQHPQRNFSYLVNKSNGQRQKLGTFLQSKVFQRRQKIENVGNERCSFSLLFLIKDYFEED